MHNQVGKGVPEWHSSKFGTQVAETAARLCTLQCFLQPAQIEKPVTKKTECLVHCSACTKPGLHRHDTPMGVD